MKHHCTRGFPYRKHSGIVVPLTLFLLVVMAGFVALSVDIGKIGEEQIKHQNAVDAAALAAAQEIQIAVRDAAASVTQNTELTVQEQLAAINSQAVQQATDIAIRVAASNGLELSESEVEFGKQTRDPDGNVVQSFDSSGPYNLVRIQSDANRSLFFAPVIGIDNINVQAKAVAYIESRDIVLVEDFSRSMMWDSGHYALSTSYHNPTIPLAQVTSNLDDMWDALVNPKDAKGDAEGPLYFKNTTTRKYPTTTTAGESAYGSLTVGQGRSMSDYGAFTPHMIAAFTSGHSQVNAGGALLNLNTMTAAQFQTLLDSHTLEDIGEKIDDVQYWDDDEIDDVEDVLVDMTATQRDPFVDAACNECEVGTDWSYGTNGRKWIYYQMSTSYDTRSMAIAKMLGLTQTSGGSPVYPFPVVGADSGGTQYSMPSSSTSNSRWADYVKRIRYYRNDDLTEADSSNSRIRYYGTRNLMSYCLYYKAYYGNTGWEDGYRTQHYPFYAMKPGANMLIEFLDGLDFGDQLGLVSYSASGTSTSTLTHSSYSKVESVIDSEETITDDYDQLLDIQFEHQAAHYSSGTGMGFGINRARDLLNNEGRLGAQPMLVVLTDGMANAHWSGYTPLTTSELEDMTDGYNGEGTDYTIYTGDDGTYNGKNFAFRTVKDCVNDSFVVHTLVMGENADTAMMKSMAFAGRGVYYEVPGISSSNLSDEVISEMQEVFAQIAASVPAVKLLHETELPAE